MTRAADLPTLWARAFDRATGPDAARIDRANAAARAAAARRGCLHDLTVDGACNLDSHGRCTTPAETLR